MLKSKIKLGTALLKHKLTGKRIPLMVCLQVTKNCNLRCNYCYVDFNRITKAEELSGVEIMNLVDEMYSCGTRWIRLMGGEPLLRDDIGDIIKYIKMKGMLCDIATNGTLIMKRTEEIKMLDTVSISIDGPKHINDKTRGGDYKAIMNGIDYCLMNKVPVRLHGLLTKFTQGSLSWMASFAKDKGIYFNFADCTSHNPRQDELLPTKQQRFKFYVMYRTYKKSGYPISNSLITINYLIYWPGKEKFELTQKDIDERGITDYIPCKESRLTCFVDVDGMVYPCVPYWEKKGINCFKHGFKKAWEHLADMKCVTCKTANHDLSMVFGLNPKMFPLVFNVLRGRK